MLALFLSCGVLTLSKAFGLFLVLLLLYRLTGLPSPRHIVTLTLLGAAVAFVARDMGLTEGKFEHVSGLASAISHVFAGHLFGEGLGNAGNYADEGADLDIGAESGLGNLLAQTGLFAVVYVVWIQSLARDVLRRGRERRDRASPFIAAMVLGWFVSFLFSASSLGVGGNALIFTAVGLYLHRHAPRSSNCSAASSK